MFQLQKVEKEIYMKPNSLQSSMTKMPEYMADLIKVSLQVAS